jgi:TonB family protein
MNTLPIYLAESSISLVLFYAVYWFFLRKETFFRVNRFYLLLMVLFSLCIPLIPFEWIIGGTSGGFVMLLEPVIISPDMVKQTMMNHLQLLEIGVVIYITGVALFLARFILQLVQLFLIKRRSGTGLENGQKVVFVDRGYAPFSFFNLVFINKNVLKNESLAAILEHERVHINQLHSLDMILVEIATAVQWFNPIMWLTRREMKTIHEYLADDAVLQNGISRSSYQQMILDETMGVRVNGLTNNFNVSLLKKRIVMITKQKSNTWAKGKLFFALPALLLVLLIFSARSISNTINPNAASDQSFNPIHLITSVDPLPLDKPEQKPEIGNAPGDTAKEKPFTRVEKMPEYQGGHDALVKFLVANIQYPAVAKQKKVQGTVYVSFVVKADGVVTNVKIKRGIGNGCDEEAMRVVKLMPKWVPGEQKGKPVDVQFVLPIQFKLS